MKAGKLYNSAAFRLTMLYILLFGASVAVLMVFIYSTITAELERQLKYDISIQLADLGRKFIRDGVRETAATIEHLVEQDREDNLVLMLIDRNWNIIAGNMETWPGGSTKPSDWITFPVERPSGHMPRKALAANSSLPRGYILLVGRKLDAQEKIRSLISDVLFICFGITALLAAVGGLIMSRTIRMRLERVNAVCETVMLGQLQSRVEVTGSADEFDHLAYNVNRMLQRIEELISGVRDISYNVAHDLRTPLNRLRNRMETVLHQDMSLQDQEEHIRACLYEIDELVGTFNSILRISQAEMGAGIEQFNVCKLSDILSNVIDLYRPLAEDRHIHILAEVTPDVFVHGDRHLLSQSFANVLDNAIKYSPVDTQIFVSLESKGELAEVVIKDQGAGVPDTFFERITDKFFRLESSRTTAGNGLGLSLVQAAIKLHQGKLWFANNQPGLAVHIELPTIKN